MRALILTPAIQRRLAELRTFAEANPLSLYQVKKIIEGVSPPPGDDERFVCHIPRGYRCVFTIETHRNDTTVRHLSVSVDGDGNYPNPVAVEAIMGEFGFTKPMKECLVRLEKEVEAINVIEEIRKSS